MIDNVTTIHGATTRGARAAVALLALALPLLSACAGGSVQNALGMGKRSPDEFAVVSRAPLVVPPDFDLRPPRPGEARPLAGTTGDQARATLLGEAPAAAERPAIATQSLEPASSAGQQALLGKAGGGNVDPEIRRRIAEENQSLATVEQAMFTRLLKWREPAALGAVVDAPAEAERLLANRASGQPITTGDTPTVVERRQSPLGALVEKVF
jgi:Protein of unknown function (DUF3035)